MTRPNITLPTAGQYTPAAMDWQKAAACRTGVDPEAFFRTHNDRRGNDTYPPEAVACCRRCPSQQACLEFALADPSITGYWGGTGDDDRKQLRRAVAREATA